MSKVNLLRVQSWIDNVSIYPPSEMFFQAPKSQEKKERRTKDLCEHVYRFNWEGSKYPHPVGTTRELVREMVVLDKLFEGSDVVPNYQPVVDLVAKFLDSAYNLLDELLVLYEKAPNVLEWAKKWSTGEMMLHSIGEIRIFLFVMDWAADILRLEGDEQRTKFTDDVSKNMRSLSK